MRVARQAVLDAAGDLVGYELLFRRHEHDESAGELDGDVATSAVITSAFLDHGIDHLVGPRLAFVNCTRPFLTGEIPLPFGPERVVLEVLEDVVADAELLAGLARLRGRGYRLALDDFVLTDRTEPLLAHADIVKLEVLGRTAVELAGLVAHLRGRVPRLLAEKIEDDDLLARCRELGFDLYQGYALGRPTTVRTGEPLQPSQVVCLRLMALLADDETPAGQVLDCVRSDPALTLRVLHAANAASAGRRQQVTSLGHAIVCVGRKALMGWSMLTLMASDSRGRPDVAAGALARARFCELLAAHAGVDPDAAFTAGFLSCLGRVFAQPLLQTLGNLNLHPDLMAGAVGGAGPLGSVVLTATGYDDLSAPLPEAPAWRPDGATLAKDYLASVVWSERTLVS